MKNKNLKTLKKVTVPILVELGEGMFKKTAWCVICLCSLSGLHAQSFQSAQQSYRNQQYGLALNQATTMLDKVFLEMIKGTYKSLPLPRRLISSNQSYSFDMQNKLINYNVRVEYSFQYNHKYAIRLALLYDYEEAHYYKTYINSAQYTMASDEIPTYKMKRQNDFYLWNISEYTAYYVSDFGLHPEKIKDTVPGLLLKIEFLQKVSYSPEIENIINQIIESVDWDTLKKLYTLE